MSYVIIIINIIVGFFLTISTVKVSTMFFTNVVIWILWVLKSNLTHEISF